MCVLAIVPLGTELPPTLTQALGRPDVKTLELGEGAFALLGSQSDVSLCAVRCAVRQHRPHTVVLVATESDDNLVTDSVLAEAASMVSEGVRLGKSPWNGQVLPVRITVMGGWEVPGTGLTVARHALT